MWNEWNIEHVPITIVAYTCNFHVDIIRLDIAFLSTILVPSADNKPNAYAAATAAAVVAATAH